MLNFPLWRRLVVIGLTVLALGYAVPNLFYPRVELHNDAVAAIEAWLAEGLAVAISRHNRRIRPPAD